MKKTIALTMLLILLALTTGSLVSGEDTKLPAVRVGRDVADFQPASMVCGDYTWDGCEFCGHDAYATMGRADMNHDCKGDLIDVGMMSVALGDQDLSGDLNDDSLINLADVQLLNQSIFNPNPFPNCTPCPLELPQGCSGRIRVSFSSDPTVDLDQIPTPTLPVNTVYIVAEGCNKLAAYSFELHATGDINLIGTLEWQAGTTYPPLGSGAEIIAQAFYTVDGSQTGSITIESYWDPLGDNGLAWTTATPPQEFEFATISHGGINQSPPPDGGCDPICGDNVWSEDPCEFCGSDAYAATDRADMNHDCNLDLIDLGMWSVALNAQDISGDLNDDTIVNITDQGLFNESFFDPGDVPGCTPCGVEPLGCTGRIRVSFSDVAAEDLDQIDEPSLGATPFYIVAEGCENLAAFAFDLEVSPGLQLAATAPCPYGALAQQIDSGANIIAEGLLIVTTPLPYYEIKIVPCGISYGTRGLSWTSVSPPQELEFATISHGAIGIDAEPPPDDDGCFDCNVNDIPDADEDTQVLAFCIVGDSDNVAWDWGIREVGGNGFSYVTLNEGPLPAGAPASEFANTFVEAINTKTCGSIHAELVGPVCFKVTVPGTLDFEFGAAPHGSPLVWLWPGGIVSTTFNPTITLGWPSDVPEKQAFNVQIYPNPFNPTTQVTYNLPRDGHLTIKIFNPRGELVKTLIDEQVSAGVGEVPWNGRDSNDATVAAGVYFYQAVALGESVRGKIALVK